MPVASLGQRGTRELDFVQIAREIAIDHSELGDILNRYQISPETWTNLKANPQFSAILESQLIAWNAATNTYERTKLKAAALIEEFLPEAHERLHAPAEPLSGKVELFKALSRIAGMGENRAESAAGERFSVTINLGADQLHFEKDVTPRSNEPAAASAAPVITLREAADRDFGRPAALLIRNVDPADQL